jgi:LysR family transcriptional regulator, low CO2-responsive transcriptional regulator
VFHATLQQLRLFAAVAEHGSVTRAAQEVHLTQPAVSIQIKRLEGKVGMPLIEHIGKELHLTVAGEEVFGAAKDVLERLGDLETSLNDLRGEVSGPLNIHVVSSGKYFMPHLLGSFVRRYPKVEPRLQITNRASLLAGLAKNQSDLYIMGQPPEGVSVVEYPFLENILVVVARPDHPLAGKKKISLARIAKERFVGRESGSGTRKAVEKLFGDKGLSMEAYIELDSAEGIKQGVTGGLGIGVLSKHSLRLELEAGELVVLDVVGFPLRRRWYVSHREGKRLSRAAQRFLQYLQEEGEEEVAELLAIDQDSESVG